MNILSSSSDLASNTFDKDVLSVFRQHPEKNMTIQYGMSEQEISEIVSDKIIAIVKEQFQATEKNFQSKKKR